MNGDSLPFYLLALVAAAMDAPEWSAWVWGATLAAVIVLAIFLGPFWWISWWGFGLLTVACAVLIVRYMLN